MFRKFIAASVILLAGVLSASAMTGLEIMKKSEAVTRPKNARTTVQMVIYKENRIIKRKITGMAMDKGNVDKALLKVVSPFKMKILTHSVNGNDQQWLKQKNGKIKKIISGDRKKPVVNSHFFYEDMKSRNINDSVYKLAGNATIEGFNCYKIIATPKPGKSVYKKAIFYVRQNDYFIIQSDIYFKGYLYKKLVNYNIKEIDGILTPKKSIMYRFDRNGKNLGRTELILEKVRYNDPSIKSHYFNKSRL